MDSLISASSRQEVISLQRGRSFSLLTAWQGGELCRSQPGGRGLEQGACWVGGHSGLLRLLLSGNAPEPFLNDGCRGSLSFSQLFCLKLMRATDCAQCEDEGPVGARGRDVRAGCTRQGCLGLQVLCGTETAK